MKKIVTLLLASVFVSAMAFGQDAPAPAIKIAASVVMVGNLWGTNGFTLDNKNQMDGDLFQFSIDAGTAGASANLVANLDDGSGFGWTTDSKVYVRQAKVWFKPFNELKVNLGWVGNSLYTEQLNWWMVTNANGGQQNSLDGYGLGLEINPVAGLSIAGTIVPGAGKNFLYSKEIIANANWSAKVKYDIAGFGSIGGLWTDNGYGSQKTAKVGFDCNAIPGLYFFLQGVLSFENVGPAAVSGVYAAGSADYRFYGLGIDPYVALSVSGFSAKLTVPVVIRLSGNTGDDSYITWDLKVAYQVLDNLTPFIRFTQNGDKSAMAKLYFSSDATKSQFAPAIQLGADYSIGKASLMTAVRIDIPQSGATGALAWSIPFEARVSF